MVKRLNKKHVTFHFPFAIDGIQHVFRRGEYTIETEEESLPGGAVIRFRHVETVLIAHPQDHEHSPTSFWAVDPDGSNPVRTRGTLAGIAADGSAQFRVPVDTPVYFQLLDEKMMMVFPSFESWRMML